MNYVFPINPINPYELTINPANTKPYRQPKVDRLFENQKSNRTPPFQKAR